VALLERLTAAAEGDERILAVTEGGSAVAGELDEFSDVDVLIVCSDDGHGSLLGEAKEFAAGLGSLLSSFTGEHVGEPRLLICLYGPPLLHVDLKFVARGELDQRVEDGIVVWERKAGLVAAAATEPAHWPSPHAQWIEDRFWPWVHYIAAKIGRGELFECVSGFAYLRDVVFGPMLAARADRRPQGARRLELYAGDALPLLERTLGAGLSSGCAGICTSSTPRSGCRSVRSTAASGSTGSPASSRGANRQRRCGSHASSSGPLPQPHPRDHRARRCPPHSDECDRATVYTTLKSEPSLT
jgi:predicted nucleotidyltransferase